MALVAYATHLESSDRNSIEKLIPDASHACAQSLLTQSEVFGFGRWQYCPRCCCYCCSCCCCCCFRCRFQWQHQAHIFIIRMAQKPNNQKNKTMSELLNIEYTRKMLCIIIIYNIYIKWGIVVNSKYGIFGTVTKWWSQLIVKKKVS